MIFIVIIADSLSIFFLFYFYYSFHYIITEFFEIKSENLENYYLETI